MVSFDEVFSPRELADKICDCYCFSDRFGDYFCRFLDQAPTALCGGFRALDEYAAYISDRLGWSFSKASAFVRCDWPLSLSDKASMRGAVVPEEVA